MAKLSKEFFTNNEVILIGYSSKSNSFSKMIYTTFVNKGIKVYPVNKKSDSSYDIKIYNNLSEIKKVPECAYVLLNKENTKNVVKELADNGVRKVLFQSSKTVDQETLDECKNLGIEAVVACPMMILGSGIHRIHAFFAGVR